MIVFHDPEGWNTSERAIPNARSNHWKRGPPVRPSPRLGMAATYQTLKSARSSVYVHVVQEDFADFDPNTPAYPKICKYAARTRSAAAEIAPGLSDSAQAVADLCLLALYIVVLAVK